VINIFLKSSLLFAKEHSREFEFNFQGKIYLYESNFIADLENGEPLKKDEPFRYHCKLLELLIATTLISAEKSYYDPTQLDIDSRDNFTISVSKLKK
jgi:inositol 1,4,5-triphosphate receptor type 1/inositol 1,4,5-triphosphate receptor type 3